ncbi:hypothetical protein LNV08_22315, partial [Paucibacter sp. TC2R-5]|uniref:hypothetical protein n=1 Tax=Paucibacter sp. TC2R-5 TaxID=2893555 RepID=UPI0021E48C15
IITRRFSELRHKAEATLAAKVVEFHDQNGKAFYKIPSGTYREWATNVLNLLQRTFGESSVHYKHFAESYSAFQGWVSDVEVSFGIFKAAEEDYLGGYLFQIRTLARAEVLSDALDQAKELLRLGYKDPACILARVALESALKDLSAKNGVAEGKLDRMNAELTKAGAFNVVKQKQITAWADIGNKAAHG